MNKTHLTRILGATITLVALMTSPVTRADHLPLVTIWETPNANGGTYTVSVDSTQSPFQWVLNAFAVTTDMDTTGVNTFRSGWGADLISSSTWDAGVDYEVEDPMGGFFPLFSTGPQGVGTFAQVFGSGSSVAVFWTSIYFAAGIGPNNTTSDFEWLDGAPASTAFALLSGGPDGDEFVACPVGLNGPGGSCVELTSTVPIPAAVWLFGSGLLGLLGVARRK